MSDSLSVVFLAGCEQEVTVFSRSASRKSVPSRGFHVVILVSTGSICLRTAAMSSLWRS